MKDISEIKFVWPACGEISSYAGWREHPILGIAKYHSGIDIAVDYDTPVKAARSGIVAHAGPLGDYGNAVMLDHGEGLVTIYGHCNVICCEAGTLVRQGSVIALSGSTGLSTGPHLHFEIRLQGQVLNPLDFLDEADNIC